MVFDAEERFCMASAVTVSSPRKLRDQGRSKRRSSGTRRVTRHQPTDSNLEATAEDLQQIRAQLSAIKRMLARLFGRAYDGGPTSSRSRARAAALIEENFD